MRQGQSRFSPRYRVRKSRQFKLEVFANLEDRTVPTMNLATTSVISDEILVQYSSGTNVQLRAQSRYNLNVQLKDEILSAERLKMGDGAMELIKLPTGMSNQKALEWFSRQPGVVFAEPNYHVTASAVSNDTYYTNGQLWGMEGSDSPTSVGPVGTTNIYGINAEAAWNDGQTGSKSIFVGIVDTGVQVTHPDLVDNIWINPYDAVDGIDNDGNGYVDDIHGWDFENNDNSVYDSADDDHGTHVAGTIGGKGGNGAGVAGVNWNVTMISAKFLGTNGGTTADAVRAIDYFTDLKTRHGMDVVATNNSWGGGGYSAALHSAIIRAAKADILTIIAAGNSANNNDSIASYPSNTSTLVGSTTTTAASYEGVIAVASLDSSGAMSSFSSYGKNTVDIAAPGAGIMSSVPSNTYAAYSGTSMATPHVTGSVALLASKYPNATASQIRTAILATAIPTTSVTGKVLTDGRLNVQAALNYSGFNTTPSTPSLSIANVSKAEGNSGTSNMVFTVTLSQAAASAVTVNYATSNLTATAGTDYVAGSGTVTIAAGSTTGTFNVVVNGDTTVETDETLRVTLSGASSNATIGTATATGTITNDDVAPPVLPSLSIANVSKAEGNSGTSNLVFTVTLSQAAASAVTVNYATSDVTATAGTDYVANSGTLTIAAGSTTGTFNVVVNGDTTVETDETLRVTLSGASSNATIGTATATGTITNDDVAPLPSLSIASVSKAEGNSGTSNLMFTVTLSQAAASAVTVNYATSNLTARSGTDYVAGSGTVTIAAGSTTGTFNVVVNGDTTVESDETLRVTLSAASSNATIGTATATGTITNDDVAPPVLPSLSIANVSKAEGNSGTSNLVFTVTLSQAAASAVTVNYATSNLTATAGTDYVAGSGTVTIAAGSTTGTFNVVVNGDTTVETDETLRVTLSGASSNATIVTATATGTITNDDVAPPTATPTLSISNATLVEGNSGKSNMVFTVTLSQATTSSVKFDYYTSGITATPGEDYVPLNTSMTIPAGSVSATFSVAVYGDTKFETDETFAVYLANSGRNAKIAVGRAVGTISNDDLPSVTISDVEEVEGDSGTTSYVFSVQLSDALATDVTMDYTTSDLTATAGVDYEAKTRTLVIPAGSLVGTITINGYGDTTVENDEQFKVLLSNISSNAVLQNDTGIGTIKTDEFLATTITSTDTSVIEGNRSTNGMNFTLTRSGNLDVTSSVFVYTDDTNGTATEWDDYRGDYGTVTFQPGETTKTVRIRVYGDKQIETDETFKLILAYPTNAQLAVDSVIGTILNDDNNVRESSITTGNGLPNDLQTLVNQPLESAVQTLISKKRSRLFV
jgi:subtilisin family serine protease